MGTQTVIKIFQTAFHEKVKNSEAEKMKIHKNYKKCTLNLRSYGIIPQLPRLIFIEFNDVHDSCMFLSVQLFL